MKTTKELKDEINENITAIRSYIGAKFDEKDFKYLKRFGKKITESTNKFFKEELEILGAQLKFVYREDGRYQHGWSASDYFDNLYLILISGSNLEGRSIPMGNFRKSGSYTTECNCFIGIEEISEEGLISQLNEKEAKISSFKRKLKNNFNEEIKRKNTYENWKKYLEKTVLPVLIGEEKTKQIFERKAKDSTYLDTLLNPRNFTPEKIQNKFTK